MRSLSEQTYSSLASKFEEPTFFKRKALTRLDAFRQLVGRPNAEIDYDLIASIIAGMAEYSQLLFNRQIKPTTGITFVRKNQERAIFNKLFASSDRKLAVELQRGTCTVYILNRSDVTICWKTTMHVIRSLHEICDEAASDHEHYAVLITKAHKAGWISKKLRSMMEKKLEDN